MVSRSGRRYTHQLNCWWEWYLGVVHMNCDSSGVSRVSVNWHFQYCADRELSYTGWYSRHMGLQSASMPHLEVVLITRCECHSVWVTGWLDVSAVSHIPQYAYVRHKTHHTLLLQLMHSNNTQSRKYQFYLTWFPSMCNLPYSVWSIHVTRLKRSCLYNTLTRLSSPK